MTLDETVLRKLADWHPARGSRQTLAVPDEGSGWAVSLVVDRHDELSSALWELDIRRVLPRRGEVTLESWANGIASRVTGLLEPLRVLEIDSEPCDQRTHPKILQMSAKSDHLLRVWVRAMRLAALEE